VPKQVKLTKQQPAKKAKKEKAVTISEEIKRLEQEQEKAKRQGFGMMDQ